MGALYRASAVVRVVLALASVAAAEPDEGPKPRVDPDARPGDPIVYAAPPAPSHTPACSFRWPICVHSTPKTPARTSAAILAAAEQAWAALDGPLALPPPDVDPSTGRYAIYVVEGADGPETRLLARDVRSKLDRARAFTVLDASLRPGCALETAVMRAVARAAIYRTAPAMDEPTARAESESLATLVSSCGLAFAADAVHLFQSHADRTVADGRAFDAAAASASFVEGASLFWSRIEWAYSRRPGALVGATWTLAPTETPVGARVWRNEPDAWDVLRVSFKNALSTGSTLADVMLDVAVARAFMGDADDGLHLPETRTLGPAARVPLDWDIPWPKTARRLAARNAPAPSGASYLRIATAGAAPHERLRVEIAWEQHALFRWAFVKLDAQGREIGRVVIPTQERATEANMTLADLSGATHVLLVGANVGDPAYAFDPDDAVWEPHGWLVTIGVE